MGGKKEGEIFEGGLKERKGGRKGGERKAGEVGW